MALNLLDDAEALKMKAIQLNSEDPADIDSIMVLLALGQLAATMAQAYIAVAELDS